MIRLLIALLTLPALASAQVRPAPPRATPAPMTGTATLAGTVVSDDADARPIRRAAVTLFAPGDVRRQWVTSTDDNGRFAFGAVPAGNFSLYASKPGFVRAHYGARRAGSTVGVPVAVPDAQAVTNLTLKMARGAVITGSVFDERGRPMSAVTVRVRRVTRTPDGTRSLALLSIGTGTGLSTTTDDRGVYRTYGLAPGEYIVSAEPVLVRPGLGVATDGTELRQPTDAELQWAERQLQPAARAPAAPPPPGQTITYAEVFHPGVVDQTAATPIVIAAGEERTGVDLRMRFVPTARVQGTVVDRNGQPATAVQVTLLPRATVNDEVQRQVLGDVGLVTTRSQRTGADGTFTLRGVDPGQYTLIARGLERTTPPVPLWAASDVDVNGRDLEGLSLTLAPSMSISGRVSFEGSAPPDAVRLQLRLTPAQAGLTASSTLTSLSTAAPNFAIPGVVPGRYRLSVVLAGATVGSTLPWSLKSVSIAGRETADAVFEVRPGENVSDVVLTLSDAMASISGVVSDSAGRSSSELSLLLFSADRAQWFVSSRRLRAPIRAASDGRFSFTGLPAGDYYLAAVNDFEPNGWFSPEFLDQLVASAVKITVGDGEKKTQDVRIGGEGAVAIGTLVRGTQYAGTRNELTLVIFL